MNFALSDSCCATCLASTAPVYSLLKVRLVMDTSSSRRLKYFARAVRRVRMSRLTTCHTTHILWNSARCWKAVANCRNQPSVSGQGEEMRLTSRIVKSWLALYCAMTLFRVSCTVWTHEVAGTGN